MSRPGFPINRSETITVHNHYRTASGTTFDGTDPSFSRAQFEDKVGSNTPGWPNNKQTNSYLRSKFTWEQNPLSVDGTVANGDTWFGDWGNTFSGGYYPWSDDLWGRDDQVEDLKNYLISSLIGKIQKTHVQLGEVAHTRQQTSDLIGNAASRLGNAIIQIKGGNPAGAVRSIFGSSGRGGGGGGIRRTAGGVQDQWLALRYGWLPLISDCYNSVSIVHKAWNDNGDLMRVSAYGTRDPDRKVKVARFVAHGPELEWRCTSRALSGRAAIVYGTANAQLASLESLGIINPLSLAWELLPYSFVFDWFLPIGNFLQSLDYSAGLSFKHGWMSMKQTQSVTLRIKQSHVVSGDITGTWSGGSGGGSAMVFERNVLGSFPTPPLPKPDLGFSPIHMANGLALLASAIERRL